jgi:hypothetical protein
MRRRLALLLTLITMGLVACTSSVEEVVPTEAPTQAPPPVIVIEPSPTPERTPLPPFNPTPYPNDGQMLTRFDSHCAMGQFGPELNVHYLAEILEGTAEISRVQLLVDGRITEDSGHIANQVFEREVRYRGGPNRIHQIEFRVTVRGNEIPRSAIAFVRCPASPRDFQY